MSIKDSHMTELEGESLNITEHNIEQLKQLFPNVFTEGKIDFDALKSELGEHIETSDERYQFTWAGKEQAKRIATTPTLGTLRPAPDESVDWDTTENLYIEGDNLEVLKLLQKSYFNQVKMIYIDPPYNTGNDFVYKDDFKDNLANYQRLTGQLDEEGNPLSTNRDSTGRYHSNWLNMMYPRLKLARNLLRDDGVIFISIDDNEVHNLRKACDEIFGEANFVETIIWKKRSGPPNDKFIAATHEYIIMYAKAIDNVLLYLKPRSDDQLRRYQNPDNHPKGRWAPDNLMANTKGGRYVSSLYFPIVNPNTGEENFPSSNGNWRYNKERINELLKNDEIYFGADGKGRPQLKRFLSDVRSGVPFSTNWDDVGYGNTATRELASLLGSVNIFDTPKPLNMLKSLLKLSTSNNDIILDFFAGSSSTADAILNFNSKSTSNRKFIMVQIPEPTPENSEARKAGYDTIAEIGKERIRRAAAKIREEHPDTEADLGFKVFKLDTSNIKKWQPTVDTLAADLFDAVDNIEEERTPADLLYEVLLKYGLPLTLPVEEIKLGEHSAFNVAMGSLVACFDENITLDTVQAIIELATAETPVLRVVFRDNGFKDDIVKTNAIQRLKQAGIEDILSI